MRMREQSAKTDEVRVENNKTFDKELNAAFRELHEKYGNDFQAFLRDVQELLRKQRTERENHVAL
jgi:hypothetical protein